MSFDSQVPRPYGNPARRPHQNGSFGQRRRYETRQEPQQPVEVFTHLDKTVKKYSVVQAYHQAAMVLSDTRMVPRGTRVFNEDPNSVEDAAITLTAVAFNDLVSKLIRSSTLPFKTRKR